MPTTLMNVRKLGPFLICILMQKTEVTKETRGTGEEEGTEEIRGVWIFPQVP